MEAAMKVLTLALSLTVGTCGAAIAATEAAPDHPRPICFSPREIDSTKPISDREIVFKMRNGKMWLNTLKANCPGLKFEDGFSWNIRGDTVCENLQAITVLRRGNSCLLGAFTPYTPPSDQN
jgi:hypothetical protein